MERRSRSAAIRVAVLCDFLEEAWPSMDLAGDMLCERLAQDPAGIAVTRLRPPFQRRLSRIPFLREKLAFNTDRLVNRFADYPRWVRGQAGQFDLFHLVDHSYAQLVHSLPARRTVVTCHDLDTFGSVLEPECDPRPAWYRAMARRTLEGFRKAAHVLAVSAATREHLLRHGLFPPERISVVSNGTHPSCSPLPDPRADDAAARLLRKSPDDTVWLLNVGSTIPRKRIDALLRVFAAIHRQVPNVRLLRVGGPFTPEQSRLAADLNIAPALQVLPFLERAVLAAIYRRAALLLHTAEAEGFGLPLIEAMACGCPVVASDIPVLREVCAAAAVYCPVADVEAWQATVIGLLEERERQPSVWEARRSQGLDRAARFSWDENARQTALIYQQVLAEI